MNSFAHDSVFDCPETLSIKKSKIEITKHEQDLINEILEEFSKDFLYVGDFEQKVHKIIFGLYHKIRECSARKICEFILREYSTISVSSDDRGRYRESISIQDSKTRVVGHYCQDRKNGKIHK